MNWSNWRTNPANEEIRNCCTRSFGTPRHCPHIGRRGGPMKRCSNSARLWRGRNLCRLDSGAGCNQHNNPARDLSPSEGRLMHRIEHIPPIAARFALCCRWNSWSRKNSWSRCCDTWLIVEKLNYPRRRVQSPPVVCLRLYQHLPIGCG